jgi:hypothetical protein
MSASSYAAVQNLRRRYGRNLSSQTMRTGLCQRRRQVVMKLLLVVLGRGAVSVVPYANDTRLVMAGLSAAHGRSM